MEKKLQDAHVDHLNLGCEFVLITLSPTHSLTWILMQREDNILEWTFLAHRHRKKVKDLWGKVSELILKGKFRLH